MTVAPEAEVASAVTSACGTIIGAVVSVIVTCEVSEALFPEASVAVQVTSVSPNGKS